MHCYVCHLYVLVSNIGSEIQINCGYVLSGHCIYVSKDMRIRGYFSKPKGVREQKILGNTVID